MSNYVYHNGELKKSDEVLISYNDRSFRYGDGLFETMRIDDGTIPYLKYHFERLYKGMQLLKYKVPSYFNEQALKEYCSELYKKNACNGPAKARLTISRGGGELFHPDDRFQFILECEKFQESSKMSSIGIYKGATKPMNQFSNLKSANYLTSVMAALHARENNFDDCIILNAAGRVCETSIANIFIERMNKIITPPLSEGCVDGVMRRVFCEKNPVTEQPLSLKDLEAADEIFTTNAVRGVVKAKVDFQN